MWRGVSSGWGRVCDVAGVSGWLSETWVFLYGDVTREGCATGAWGGAVSAQVKTHGRFAHGPRPPPADTARNCSDPCWRPGELGEQQDGVLRSESKRLKCSQGCTDRTVQGACQSPGRHISVWLDLALRLRPCARAPVG